ncbi:DMT family transporter [Variovorax sp. Sphag1AA]|uniref:DMT family transporter n=1 Tax=Variovorax sp. Sphag1AA TaxID=2587027 RepID=UPI00161343D8|nr:DMT family transporter [Variovorax sp. Sphag1AA]MBB3181554.1 drug/metabolite transporter (DMT)-like permease [Variovorax sp. Sphag1AA]
MTHPGNLRSISAMLAACAMFACMDASVKALASHYPPLQVTALRGFTSLPLVSLYILWRRELGAVAGRHVRWGLHLLRGVIGVVMLTMFTTGLRSLGLAEAYTLSFVAPLLITILAIPLLGERVKARHWTAIAVGFAGIVVALRPNQAAFLSIGALAVLAAAVGYAIFSVLGRLIGRTEPSSSLVLWTTMCMAVFGGALALPQWIPVRAEHGLLLAGLAVSGFLGQLAISEAFRHGQAAAVAPFEYSALAWAMLIDWTFWRTAPDAWTLAGAAIIIGSGIYLVRHELPAASR